MGNKNKTVSFRINEAKFGQLREIAEEKDISLSAVFRDYVDRFIAHDGQVEVVPKHRVDGSGADHGFPVTVEVSTSFVREHERLELEAEHLREQLGEYRRYVTRMQDELDEREAEQEEVIHLEDLDAETGDSLFLDLE